MDKQQKSNNKLPDFFKPLFWSYNFSAMNPEKNQKTVIVNTINYGDWQHWKWIVGYYGKNQLKRIIENIAASEFRKRALKLICLLLGIKELKYASRGAKIAAERNIS